MMSLLDSCLTRPNDAKVENSTVGEIVQNDYSRLLH